MSTFEAPGAGRWNLDLSHYQGGTTPIVQDLVGGTISAAYEQNFEQVGVPARTVAFEWVNGFVYTRLLPLVGANRSSTKPPPVIAVKLLSRIHPEFRKRAKRAAASLADPPWPATLDEWYNRLEDEYTDRNTTLQNVDLASLDDVQLADHIVEVFQHAKTMNGEHHRLHNADLGPIGQLVFACRGWGIAGAEVVATLSGASPHTSEPARQLGAIRSQLEAEGFDVEAARTADPRPTLDELRSVSGAVAAMIDEYMGRQGWVMYSSYDLDGRTLAETPSVLVNTILSGVDRERTVDHETAIATLRERVPESDRERFDTMVASARSAMGMRDAQGPLTVEWPIGLLRRVLLEAGRRLHADEHLVDADHVFELTLDQVTAAVRDRSGPSADEIVAMAAERARLKALDAPRTLGPEETPPPLDALQPALAELVGLVQAAIEELGLQGPETLDPAAALSGTGIGSGVYTGRARVATSAEEAMGALEPGDVLITTTTTPAYNLVLTLVGGLVTAEGGPMCHAAVLSRELGISAVIGAHGALEAIPDGATVEVDPDAGEVRIIDPV